MSVDITTASTTRDVVESFWSAFSTGDTDRMKTVVSPGIEWTVVGRTVPIAKTYAGWAGFFDELLATLGASFVPGSLSMTRKGTYVDEAAGVAVIELFESATTVDGKEFVNNIVDVFHIRDGRITAVREYMDLAEVAEAFGF